MDRVAQIREQLLRLRPLPWVVMGLTLAILGGTILLALVQVRSRIREQLAGRDMAVLQAVAILHLEDEIEAFGDPGLALDSATQATAILKTSRLKGVLAQRLFDAEGRFVFAFPPQVAEGVLAGADMDRLRRLRSTSRFEPRVPLEDLFPLELTNRPSVIPVLEINVPLHEPGRTNLAGVAQFLLEGESLAAEFRQLDNHLAVQAAAAFLVGGGILLGAMGWAFGRLRRAQRLLELRTRDLLRANQELTLAAKTSALGAVSAHLIHGLKNPLSGLQSFVNNLAGGGEDFSEAIATTRRMQQMINEVVAVLRDEGAVRHYTVALDEILELVRARTAGAGDRATVTVAVTVDAPGCGTLSNRVANLVLLILANLVENAIQATPAGGKVLVRAGARPDGGVEFAVADEGPGLPAEVQAHLFEPCRSAKEGGTGLGLALSRQLANHLGATLELRASSAQGTVFVLTLGPAVEAAPGPAVAGGRPG